MADLLSLSTNIIGLLTAASQLVSRGYAYRNSAKDFPEELQELVGELASLTGILHTLKTIADPSVAGAAQINPSIMKAINTPIQDCEKMLEDMVQKLDHYQKDGNKAQKFVAGLTWPLKVNETKDWVKKVSRYKSTFSLALSADEVALTQRICADFSELRIVQKENLEKKRLGAERQKLQDVMAWLSTADPTLNHKTAQKLSQVGTGRWLTEGDTFLGWFAKNNSFLWLYGIPGSGKTILSSLIIDHIVSEVDKNVTQNWACAYFYCDFREPAKQTVVSFLGSIISQLISRRKKLPKIVQELRDRIDAKPLAYHVEYLQNTLHYLASEFPRLFIIVDALDESSERLGMLGSLKQLQSVQNINILITSRDESDIREELNALPSLAIKEDNTTSDIRLFVTEEIKKNSKLRCLKQAMKAEIIDTLADKAQGMFLWASTALYQIGKLRNNKAIQDSLGSLPQTLEAVFERILCKIPTEDRVLAIRVLRWLTCFCSKAQITLKELIDGIAVETGDSSMEPNSRLNEPADIVEICGGLVIWGEEKSYLRLVHLSVKEYLLSTHISQGPAAKYRIQPDNANKELAKICLTYVLFNDFDIGPSLSESELRVRSQQYPLLGYAAYYWPTHISKYSPGTDRFLDQLVHDFFHLNEDSGRALSWKQVYTAYNALYSELRPSNFKDYLKPDFREHKTLLYYAAAFGQTEVVKEYVLTKSTLKMDPHKYKWPLGVAARAGHEPVVRLLLESGASPNQKSYANNTPLVHAAVGGHADCVKTLLEHGAIDAADEENNKFLFESTVTAATYYGHENVLQTLLETEHFHEASSKHFEGAFGLSVFFGFENCLRILLARGGGSQISEYEMFPGMLRGAAENGHLKALQVILQEGGANEIYAREGLYMKTLQSAAYSGQDRIVELLLNLRKSSGIGRLGISLHLAAANGHIGVVDRLIQTGASLEDKDEDGWTPALAAYAHCQDLVLEKLQMVAKNPESWKLVDTVGPTGWEKCEQRPIGRKWISTLEISGDGLGVKNIGLGGRDSLQFVKAKHPVTPFAEVSCFEVKIIENPTETSVDSEMISIGFVDGYHTHTVSGEWLYNYPPGGYSRSWAYHSFGHIEGDLFGAGDPAPRYGAGDIIGCYHNRSKKTVSFTCNGSKPVTLVGLKYNGKIVPMVAVPSGCHIRVNFGNDPFAYEVSADLL